MDYISIKTGKQISLDESIREADDLICRVQQSKKLVTGQMAYVSSFYPKTGHECFGSDCDLSELRAFFDNYGLQIGDKWTKITGDVHVVYTIHPSRDAKK